MTRSCEQINSYRVQLHVFSRKECTSNTLQEKCLLPLFKKGIIIEYITINMLANHLEKLQNFP